jgi:hypothetical protein
MSSSSAMNQPSPMQQVAKAPIVPPSSDHNFSSPLKKALRDTSYLVRLFREVALKTNIMTHILFDSDFETLVGTLGSNATNEKELELQTSLQTESYHSEPINSFLDLQNRATSKPSLEVQKQNTQDNSEHNLEQT